MFGHPSEIIAPTHHSPTFDDDGIGPLVVPKMFSALFKRELEDAHRVAVCFRTELDSNRPAMLSANPSSLAAREPLVLSMMLVYLSLESRI